MYNPQTNEAFTEVIREQLVLLEAIGISVANGLEYGVDHLTRGMAVEAFLIADGAGCEVRLWFDRDAGRIDSHADAVGNLLDADTPEVAGGHKCPNPACNEVIGAEYEACSAECHVVAGTTCVHPECNARAAQCHGDYAYCAEHYEVNRIAYEKMVDEIHGDYDF